MDYLIVKGYLRVEYNGRLPMLAFTDRGWEIERDTYTKEWFHRFEDTVASKVLYLDMFGELKIVNRQVVFALLDMIKESGNKEFIPLLKAWQSSEVRKVREKIGGTIRVLETGKDGKEDM